MHADTLPALSAVARFPHLHQQVAAAIDAQQRRVSDCAASFIPRPDQDEAIDVAITTVSGGLIAIEGPPGAGVTSLLCALAARYNAPIWLPGDDHGMGIAALCAQLIALHNLPVALVTPGAGRDSTTLERLLTEVVAGREAQEPLVVVIDDISGDRAMPRPPPFPLTLPASVVILYGSAPGHAPPLRPIQRITLPKAGAALREQLIMVALRSGASQTQAASIADCADGSFLYAHLAARLIAQGLLNLSSLPQGLDQLYSFWWSGLEPISRRFFELIAAAGESVEPEYLSTLLDVSTDAVQRLLAPWRLLISEEGGKIRLQHSATSRWIETAGRLARAHTLYAKNLAAQAAERRYVSQGYPITQLARHIALSDAATRDSLAPSLEERTWVLAQERRTGTMEVSAHDLRWALSAAQGSTPLRLVRTAALAGTLALMARRMLPDAPSAALTETLANGAPRDLSLRRARALIDQLPNGRDKALALRRLGETCYTLRMRAPAMRMLSEALDLEIQGMPRSWRDEREELLVALARAAIAHGASHIALGITTLIAHTERRGLVDTEVVRYLLAHGEFTRAEEVAYAIGHAGSHEWALAEVAVGHARVSDPARASFIIATLKTATAIAWAHTELARDAARAGDPQAVATVQAIEHTLLRDRALSQVAQAYAEGAAGARAYDTALLIRDLELRARALIHVAELDSAIAEQALLEAARVTDSIQGEERITVIAALAAAHAALGSLDRALQAADGIPPGEERARAQAHIAVALARRGDQLAAHNVAIGIQDDDERAWSLDALARQMADAGQWREAFGTTAQIADADQRARIEVDLAIALARSGHPLDAHQRAINIASATERVRALSAIIHPLVAAGLVERARTAIARTPTPDLRSRYQSACAAAMAAAGSFRQARAMIEQIGRPIERARALIALTRSAGAAGDLGLANWALGEALQQVVPLGRVETLSCIAQAADALALLGGAELLLSIASAIDETDGWWGSQ